MNASSVEKSRATKCFGECPYFKTVSGTCDHELQQALLTHFKENSGAECPVYDEWRADEMALLEEKLGLK